MRGNTRKLFKFCEFPKETDSSTSFLSFQSNQSRCNAISSLISDFFGLFRCSRQRSESSQPTFVFQATWRVISRWKTLLELFQNFETLAERGRRERELELAIDAPSNGQPASRVQTDTTVVLKAPNSGLRLERERGLNHYYLPPNFSSSKKVQFLSFVFWLHKLAKWFAFFLSLSVNSSFKVRDLSTTCMCAQIQPKGDGRPPHFHLNSLQSGWQSPILIAFQRCPW